MRTIVFAFILACSLFLVPFRVGAADLTFWTTEIHEDRLQVINFLVRSFMAMQDEVSVEVVSINENELVQRMREAEKSGDAPHLVGTGSELLVALSELGCLDQESAGRVINSVGRKKFYPGVLDQLSAPNGGWYGVPFHGWVQGIWYRADWFEEAGLEPPSDWKSILAAARHFSDPSSGRYGILVGTADDHYADQVFTQIAMSNGASMFSADGRLVFDSPAMVEALEFYASLAGCSPNGSQTWRARDYFLQGKMAMMFYSTFIMDDLALERVAQNSLTDENFENLDGAPFDPDLVRNVRMAPVIRHKGSASYGMINGFGVRKGMDEEQREGAERFLAFLFQPPQYVMWLHMAPGGMLPVLQDVGQSNKFLLDPSGIFRRYGRFKVVEIIEGLSSVGSFGVVEGRRQPASSVVYAQGVIPRMIRRTVFDGMSPAESVQRAAGEIEAIAESTETQ